MAKKANKSNKVFDVAKPGKTAAGASGRPLIVGNRTLMQDPMVVKDASEKDVLPTAPELDPIDQPSGSPPEIKQAPEIMKPSPINIKPIEPIKDEKVTADKPPEESETPPVTEQTNLDSEETAENKSSNDAAVNTLAEQVVKNRQDKKEQDAEVARSAEIEKLIEDKKYFVPIGEKKRRRSIRHILVGTVLVIILGLLLVDVLMDTGVININNIQAPLKLTSQ